MSAPAPAPPLNVALFGFGYAARTFHVPLIQTTPGLQLTAIGVRSPPSAPPPDGVQIADLLTILADPEIDIVVITSPPASHTGLSLAALEAGKHVVVEKPAAPTFADVEVMAAAARRSGRTLSVFHNRRWDSDFLTLRRLLQAGTLGDVVEVSSTWDRLRPTVRDRWRERAEAGGGLWLDLGSHLVDQAIQLFGPPLSVQGDILRQRDGALVDDAFHVRLHYDGLRVTLRAGSLAGESAPRFVVNGRKATFVKHGLDGQEAALVAGGAPGSDGWGEDPSPGRLIAFDAFGQTTEQSVVSAPGDYGAFYRGLAAAIRTGAPPPVTIQEAALVMQVIEAASQSSREGRTVSLQ